MLHHFGFKQGLAYRDLQSFRVILLRKKGKTKHTAKIKDILESFQEIYFAENE